MANHFGENMVPPGGGGSLVDVNSTLKGIVTNISELNKTTLDLKESTDDVKTAIENLPFNFGGASLTNAVDDTAAAAAGVAIGQVYRNGSVLMVRVT